MKASPELITLVDRVPDLDKQGKVHGHSWDESMPAVNGVLALGADGIAQLVSLLAEVDDGSDYKPRYLLHTLVMFTGRPEQADHRTLLADTLASLLGSADIPKDAQGYLLRQLQLCGAPGNIPALASQLLDPEIGDDAAQAILAIGGESAAPAFRDALAEAPDNVRRTMLVQALGVLRDATSAPELRPFLASDNADLRLTAAKALARCGDRESADVLLALALKSEGWERLRLTDACLDLAEAHPDLAEKLNAARERAAP